MLFENNSVYYNTMKIFKKQLFTDFSTMCWTSILTITVWIQCYFHFSFSDEEIKAQRN